MANLKTTLSDPNTQFTQVKPRQAPDQAREQFASGVASLAYAGGKGYAKGAAADQMGAGVSLEQANREAQEIEQSIEKSLIEEQNLVGEPLSTQRVNEIKDRELSNFRANDRTLLALRDRGTLSTKEIDARRRMNLQDKLSNPILAMFRSDFLDAAGDYTGGSGSTSKSYFGYTPEEQEALATQEAQAKARAEHEGQVAGLVAIGVPETLARTQLFQQAETARKTAEYEAKMAERKLNVPEFNDYTRELQNQATRGITTDIYYMNSINGDAGLNPGDMMQMKTRLGNAYMTQLEKINSSSVDDASRKSAIEGLNTWKTGMENYLKSWSLGELKKEQTEYLKNEVMIKNFEEMPWLFAMSQMFPDIGKSVFEAKGQVEGRMQMIFGGEEKWAKYKQNISNIYDDMGKFASGDPRANPATVAAFASTPETFEGIQEQANQNPKVRQLMLNAYDEVPEISLRGYNQVFSAQYAEKNPAFKSEVDLAMRFAKEKLSRKAALTQNDATTIQVKTAPPTYADSMVGRKEKLIISMPANMEQYRGDMEQMYKTVDNHRWAWKHVADQYSTAADAFNGWMRGEWEFDLGLEEGVGKVQPERGVARQELQAPKAPTAEEEAALADQLEQRVEIRDRDRTVERAQGSPVSPIPQLPEQQAVQTTGKLSTDNMYDFTMEKEHPHGYTSKFTQLSDGSIGEGQANRDGKAYPYMFYVEGTGWEVDRGYGELIGSGLSEAEARKLVTETAPIDLKEAQGKVKEHLDKDFSEIKAKYPNMDKKQAEVLSMMAYQGAKVHKWKQTSKAIAAAVKSNDPVDYMTAQAHMLNSKWATQQTPERALEIVHMFYPETPIEALQKMQEGFKAKRGVTSSKKAEASFADEAKQYFSDVIDGTIAKEGLEKLATNLQKAQEGDQAAGEELMNMFMGGGIVKAGKKLVNGVWQKASPEDLINKGQKTRPAHNTQNRALPEMSAKTKNMKSFLDSHDYSYFVNKDGSISVDIYDSAGKASRSKVSNMKELKDLLGY